MPKKLEIKDILLPNTPLTVVESYTRLAQRAKLEDFDLLEEDIVVLDTETTGLSFNECQLTEIAAARLRGREIVDEFHTFVNPGQPIPKKISELTGITDTDVISAPKPKEAVAQLAEFTQGAPVLAHNALFDRTFIERAPGGHKVSDIWIDTLALSRIALPCLTTHKLQVMAEAFDCASVTHRAMDDVMALAGMWRVILCGLSNLPTGLLNHLATMHKDVEWAYRPVFSHLALANPDAPFSLVGMRKEMVGAHKVPMRNDADDLAGSLHASSEGEILSAFEPGGTISKMYETYEQRPQQTEMALLVNKALSTSSLASIEAGTGVGKSVAYLLPLALYAKKNNITCGIATKTNALTDQLISHELPALASVLPEGVSFSCLKGFDHYPCLRRLSSASHAHSLPLEAAKSANRKTVRSEATLASDMLTAIAVTYSYAAQMLDGDIDSLGIRWGSVPRGLLTTTSNECQRNRCPFYPDLCFLHGARHRAGTCDIVVTNHSLLLRDIEADHNILPPVRNWVIDEAHSFEAEARKQWALEVSSSNTRTLFETLGSNKTGVLGSAFTRTSKTEGATLLLGLLSKVAAASVQAQVASADFFDTVRSLGTLARSSAGYENTTLWINVDVRSTKLWIDLKEAGSLFIERLDKLIKALKDAHSASIGTVENISNELGDMWRRLTDLKLAAQTIISGEDTSYVYSAEVQRISRYSTEERLIAEKLDIGAELASRWYPEMYSVTFCSATITVGETFEHFNHATGLNLLPPQERREAALESCYDFNNHMAAIVASDMPDPRDPGYLKALEDLLFDIHVSMGGSVLTLFTNRREMQTVYNALAPRLSECGLDLAIQDKNTTSRRLSRRFVEEKTLSLMALKSFWEGFDAAGDTLRCVVIPKLPFSSPNDPLSQERGLRDRQAWRNWSLPEAVLSVKQAAGRLIRTSTDTGVLVLADSRLTTKGYGKVFLRSLPTENVSLLRCESVLRYLDTWLKNH